MILFLLLLCVGAAGWYTFREPKETTGEITLYGNVDIREVNLGFRVAGRVNEMFFEEGDFVKAGTLMGILDKQPYLDELKQNEAALESIRASLANATLLYNRRSELVRDGSVSQEDFDNALSTKMVQEANFKNAEAAVSISRANLFFTEVYAPSDGIVLTRIREPGTVVKASDPIYTLSIISPVWVRAFIPEPLLGVVFPGMEARIYTDTQISKGQNQVYTGRVGFISPVAEFTPKTVETTMLRSDLVYRLRIYADNPDMSLRQGMPVTVRIKLPK